mgnify:CR=1 FL=1
MSDFGKIVRQPSLSFRDLSTGQFTPTIWDGLRDGLWQKFSVENWLYNDMLTPEKIAEQKPLFPGIQQIEPGVIWDDATRHIIPDLYHPNRIETGLDVWLCLAEDFIKGLDAKRIGVHLSGGLDSSLIIATLHQLKIPFVPIGLESLTYEFRTERHIQELLIGWGEDGLLIDSSEVPYYHGIDTLPATQIPTGIFKSYYASCRLASAFSERGCDVVLGGQGGDSLLVDPVTDVKKTTFNIGNEFLVQEDDEIIYEPLGIKLMSFFGHKPIIDFLTSARIGQGDDALKLWTRKYFKDWLPNELSEYAYFADFFGLTTFGLKKAKPIISELVTEAHEMIGHPMFSAKERLRFLDQDIYSFEYNEYIRFSSTLAIAVWLKSLKNGGIIQ